MRRSIAATLASVPFVLAANSASAHHSVEGQFDATRTVTLKGKVSQVDWSNPHIYVHLDVEDAGGKINAWRLESAPPAFLRKAGLSKTSMLADGQPVTVEIYPARDGTQHLGFMYKFILPDDRYYQFHGGPSR